MSRLRAFSLDVLLPGVFGALATLGFAPFGLAFATLVGIVGLLALWRGQGPARAAWRGFVFGCAQFATGIYWVYVAMHAHGGMPPWLAGIATAGLVAYLALYPALAGALAGIMRRLPATCWMLLAVPAAWTLCEWLRGWLFTGFDWLALGYVMTGVPINGLAPVIGVHGLSFLIVAAAGVLGLLYAGSLAARGLACVIVLATPVLLWCLPPAVHWTHPTGQTLRVGILQGNVPQSEKWVAAQRGPTIARYAAMTRHTDADLIVWPEVAIPAPAGAVRAEIADIDRSARQAGRTVLVGVLRSAPGQDSYYNSVLALGAGRGEYHKRHRVPFGEYVPGPSWLVGLLSGMGAPVGSLAAGPAHQALLRHGSLVIGTSICFEDVFARDIRRDLPAAGLLVNVTNDGWFAGTNGPAQHLQIARMRAAEAGRPLVRAANTGISAHIDFTGRVYARTAENVQARLMATVAPRQGETPFVRYGETPVVAGSGAVVLLGLLGAAVSGLRRRRHGRVAERRRALASRV